MLSSYCEKCGLPSIFQWCGRFAILSAACPVKSITQPSFSKQYTLYTANKPFAFSVISFIPPFHSIGVNELRLIRNKHHEHHSSSCVMVNPLQSICGHPVLYFARPIWYRRVVVRQMSSELHSRAIDTFENCRGGYLRFYLAHKSACPPLECHSPQLRPSRSGHGN